MVISAQFFDSFKITATAPFALTSSGTITANPTGSIAAATGSVPGSMSAADFTKLSGITSGAAVASVGGTAPIVSSGGTTPAIFITAASGSAAGSMSSADFTKLANATSANTVSTLVIRASDGSANFAGTCSFTTVSAINLTGTTTAGSTAVTAGTSVASQGVLRLGNSQIMYAKANVGGNTDIYMMAVDSSDNLILGTTTVNTVPTAIKITSLATGFLGWYAGTTTQRWSIGTNNGADIAMFQGKLATAPTSYPTSGFLLYQNVANQMRVRAPKNVSRTLCSPQAVTNAGLSFIDLDVASGTTTQTTATAVTVYTPTLDGTALVEGAGFFKITIIGDDIVTHTRAMYIYDIPFNVATAGALTIPAGTFTARSSWDNIGVINPPGVQNSPSGIYTSGSTLRVYPYGKASTTIQWQVYTETYMYQPA